MRSRPRPPQVLLTRAPGGVAKAVEVGGGDNGVLDQDADGDLVRQPDVRSHEAPLADLPAQHLDVLAYPGRQPVTEGRVGVEALNLMMGVGDLERRPSDLRRPR